MTSKWLVYLWAFVFYCAPINSYLVVRLEDKLCALGAKTTPPSSLPDLTLMEDDESAAILIQDWNGTALANDCEFIVYSHPDAYRIPKGTYIAITDMTFRKNPETNECIDYIQFVDGGASAPSERICEASIVNGIRWPLILDYHQRNIRVIIHIDNSTSITERLNLRMVMTAHSQCNNKNDFLCDPQVPYSCISRHFVNDNMLNCLFPCLDESSCWLGALAESPVDPPITIVSDSVDFRIDDKEPNCITVGILEQKLKENRELLSVLLEQRENTLINQLDGKINGRNNGHKPALLKNMDNGGADVNAQTCLTKKAFEEAMLQNSQLILKAVEAPEERFKTMELNLFVFQQHLLKLMARLDQMEKDAEEPPRMVN